LRLINSLESDIIKIRERLRNFDSGTSNVNIYNGAEVDNIKIGSQIANVNISEVDSDSPDRKPTRVKKIEIYEPWLIYEEQMSTRTVKLKSSLPESVALQSGSTAVYTVVLNVKSSLIFTPAKYRLQFYVNYSFKQPFEKQSETQVIEKIYTNTLAHSLSIRPSVYSVIIGSAVGGITGAIARLLQTPSLQTGQGITVSLVLAVILGGMAVIFMARKSDTQSFVSVEDFWGGILIGFLVGYTGTSFFETLTGASAV
jgi:hypothetical protein